MASRPGWQTDAVRRFCRREDLSTKDIQAIADHLVAGTYPAVPELMAPDMPGGNPNGRPVALRAISDVKGINALMEGQQLEFEDSGLTVVYGDNASGKSGYARLLRRAVTSRVGLEVILGDVFSTEATGQAASIEYRVEGDPGANRWNLGEDAGAHLTAIRFYDSECGRAYVNSATEASYRPFALTLLDQLLAACEALRTELETRTQRLEGTRPSLPSISGDTPSGVLLRSLTANTTDDEINAMTTLIPMHDEELSVATAEEARLKGTDPKKEKSRLTNVANAWETVGSRVEALAQALGVDGLAKTRQAVHVAATAREAAAIASSRGFGDEPLKGVGSESWRALWMAARDYSVAEAYHKHEFPEAGPGARCVLCQQPLAEEAADRLLRFQAFMQDTTERDVSAAEGQLDKQTERLSGLLSLPSNVAAALASLEAGGEQVAETVAWLESAHQTASSAAAFIRGEMTELPKPVVAHVTGMIADRVQEIRKQALAIDSASFEKAIIAATTRVQTLRDAAALATARVQLFQQRDYLKAKAQIDTARRATETTGITRKSTELTKLHVTELVRSHFVEEARRLALDKVSLDPTRGRKNVTLEHRPRLSGAAMTVDVADVLSEGEQTALGLAGFLTEVALDESKSAVIFDDPVTSLDAGRRSRVANRLAELARDRQVIVFTHEVTFVNELKRQGRDLDVAITPRGVVRGEGDLPGKILAYHPWDAKDIPERIQFLEAELARIKKARPQIDAEEYSRQAGAWGGLLSEAWERAVNLEIASRLMDRGTNEIKPMMFRILPRVTEQDNRDFQAGYGKASEWAFRHDKASGFQPPAPDLMKEELDRFKTWHRRIKSYQK
jgi:energy-coupling factor transporter ATP-binding protein EcfA2